MHKLPAALVYLLVSVLCLCRWSWPVLGCEFVVVCVSILAMATLPVWPVRMDGWTAVIDSNSVKQRQHPSPFKVRRATSLMAYNYNLLMTWRWDQSGYESRWHCVLFYRWAVTHKFVSWHLIIFGLLATVLWGVTQLSKRLIVYWSKICPCHFTLCKVFYFTVLR